MNTERATQDINEKTKHINDALKKLGETKEMLLKKMAPKEHKEIKINDEQARAAITESGTVMIQFVSFEEGKKYYDKL